MHKKCRVVLTPKPRKTLESLTHTGADTDPHCIPLKADCDVDDAAWGDAAIALACDISVPTVEHVRRAFVTNGLNAALHCKRWVGPSRRKLDGQQKAHLVALDVVAAITPESVRRKLKKRTLTIVDDRMQNPTQGQCRLCCNDGSYPGCVRSVIRPAASAGLL